jgi:hypothetical protein
LQIVWHTASVQQVKEECFPGVKEMKRKAHRYIMLRLILGGALHMPSWPAEGLLQLNMDVTKGHIE